MEFGNRSLKIVVCAALLASLISCETTEKKRAAVAPPMRATAPTLTQAPPPQAAAPKIEEKPVPKVDEVAELIKRAEAEYEAGRAAYLAGHLDSSKDAFDRAFNLLLTANIAISS